MSRGSKHTWAVVAMAGAGLLVVLVVSGPWFLVTTRRPTTLVPRPNDAVVLNVVDDPPTDHRDLNAGHDAAVSVSTDTTSVGHQGQDVTVVEDDGQSLWVSPTASAPIDFEYTPAGAQLFLHVRPARLVQSDEGHAVLQSLGPDFLALQARFETLLGIQFDQIDQLLLASTAQDVGPPLNVIRVKTTEAIREQVFQRSHQKASTSSGRMARLNGETSYFPFAAADTWIVGKRSLIEEIAESTGTPPLRRQLEMLRQKSDRDRHVTVLFAPSFLASDGRSWISGSREVFRQPLLDFLGDSSKAASVSVHLNEGAYVEMSWIVPADQNASRVAVERRHELQEMPARLNAFLSGIRIDPYWQALALRVPLMVHFCTSYVRSEADGERVLLNVVLPPGAVHNLILAGELATSSPKWVRPSFVQPPESMSTLEQILEQPTSLQFEQQSLEAVMQEMSDLIRDLSNNDQLGIRILGQDLQSAGITRNQQIRRFSVQNQPVRKILTGLVQQANPKPAPTPGDHRQKLIWVVSPDDPASILITTRTAARQKGYVLPNEFVAESAPEALQ